MRDMGEQGASIDVDAVSAGGLDDRESLGVDRIAQVGGLVQAVGEIGFIETLEEAGGHGIQVAAASPP